MRKQRLIQISIAALCLIVVLAVALNRAGSLLVVDTAEKSDVAIVLAGGTDDNRILHGIELLRAGYTRELVIDGEAGIYLGRPYNDYLQEYISRMPAEIGRHVHICPFTGNSTKLELSGVRQCAMATVPGASKMLLVTSDFHTRRALSIARRLFPQTYWTVAATSDPGFGLKWWSQREWAKTCLTEWQKLIWWQLIERWRK